MRTAAEGRNSLRPEARPSPEGGSRSVAGAVPAAAQALAGLGVEQLDLGGVEPELRLFAGGCLALRVEARHGHLLAARAAARILLKLGELLGLQRVPADHEVRVELGAERLDHLD